MIWGIAVSRTPQVVHIPLWTLRVRGKCRLLLLLREVGRGKEGFPSMWAIRPNPMQLHTVGSPGKVSARGYPELLARPKNG